jgi:hypothetical protein
LITEAALSLSGDSEEMRKVAEWLLFHRGAEEKKGLQVENGENDGGMSQARM